MEANERVKDTEEEEEVWSWGAGTEGQLGTGKLQDEHLPQLLHILPSLSLLSCGGAHVIALTPGILFYLPYSPLIYMYAICFYLYAIVLSFFTDKKVLTWGRGTSGQLGHGNLVNSLEPKIIDALNEFNITHVSAGWNHSGFVSGLYSLESS